MPKYLFIAPYESNIVVMPKDGDQPLELTYKTGNLVTRPQRDAQYEDRPILDEDGKPTGKTERVFVNWGEEYQETIDEVKGGMLLVTPTYQGQETAALVLVHTSPEKRDLLDADPDWVYLSELVEAENAIPE